MNMVRDLVLTLVALLLLSVGVMALPFLAVSAIILCILVVVGFGSWILYASIHDARILSEEKEDVNDGTEE